MKENFQQVTSVYKLLFDVQKLPLSIRKYADVNKNQKNMQKCELLHKRKRFFHYFITKWKLNKISFMLVYWYFIKEISHYDVEYGLNFDKNSKNAEFSKNSRDNP